MQRAIDGKDGGAQTTQVVGSCFGCLEWCSLLFVVLLLASAAKTATETRLTSDYSILHPTPERPLPPAAAQFFAVKYHSGEQVELDAWDGGGIRLSAVDVWLVGHNDAGALKTFTIPNVAERIGARVMAQVYKIPQNGGGTLHSLGAF